MVDLLIRKLQLRDVLSPNEVAILHALPMRTSTHPRKSHIVREGEHQTFSRLLLQGWAARAKTMADGRRQITELHLPGDFVDLHSFLLKRLDHDVIALTPCTIANVDHGRLRELSETEPHLLRLLWLSTLIDAAIHREWLSLMGRASAFQQLAHLLCELHLRLQAVGLADARVFALPLIQEELADVCGITPVHVNRVLQDLRGKGLILTEGRMIEIPDVARLHGVARFDPVYLNLCNEPR